MFLINNQYDSAWITVASWRYVLSVDQQLLWHVKIKTFPNSNRVIGLASEVNCNLEITVGKICNSKTISPWQYWHFRGMSWIGYNNSGFVLSLLYLQNHTDCIIVVILNLTLKKNTLKFALDSSEFSSRNNETSDRRAGEHPFRIFRSERRHLRLHPHRSVPFRTDWWNRCSSDIPAIIPGCGDRWDLPRFDLPPKHWRSKMRIVSGIFWSRTWLSGRVREVEAQLRGRALLNRVEEESEYRCWWLRLRLLRFLRWPLENVIYRQRHLK